MTSSSFILGSFNAYSIVVLTNPNFSPPVVSDQIGVEVMTSWGTCFCSDDSPADGCGVCGGPEGIAFQGCGCGLAGNCEMLEGACDCTGRMPSNTYADGTYICWNSDPSIDGEDTGIVCSVEDCSADPNAVSYNIYRQNPIGNYTLIANELQNNEYTDTVSHFF